MRTSIRLALAVAIAASGVFAAPAAAQLGPGEVVVADSAADPDGLPGTGAVFRVDPATGAATVLGESPEFDAPRGVAIDGAGNVLVADPLAQPAGEPGMGAIFRIVPGQAPTVFATSADFEAPTGVAVDGAGNVIVTDQNADPDNLGGNTGAIFRIAPGQQPTVLKTSALFVDPWSSTTDGQGNVLVADRDGSGGSIMRFTPGQIGDPAVIGTSVEYSDPSGVAVDQSGRVLVVDPDADHPGGVDAFDGELTGFTPPAMPAPLPSDGFNDPFGIALDSSARALVADSSADQNGAGTGIGTIFRFTPGSAPAVLSASTIFRQPSAVAVAPVPAVAAPPPPAPVVTSSPSVSPPPAAPRGKKCKKGRKLRKGKCVKKKR